MPEGKDNKNPDNRYLPYCPKKQPFQGLGIVIAAVSGTCLCPAVPCWPGSADDIDVTH